ncbi:MAG: hypothetical protein HYT98_05300 [Candidatus Sungbacteria bacterium]|nr:hypothetical protein [Candidatus Sungbacteria bacterium]
MKYPWISLSILAVWFGSASVIIMRGKSDPFFILVLACIATAILAWIGFRSNT